jgi:hypothetical protein
MGTSFSTLQITRLLIIPRNNVNGMLSNCYSISRMTCSTNTHFSPNISNPELSECTNAESSDTEGQLYLLVNKLLYLF